MIARQILNIYIQYLKNLLLLRGYSLVLEYIVIYDSLSYMFRSQFHSVKLV